ncbi:hypothetical protein [Halomonas sp. 25-S5]|uniref:hypothetical protein n=1 Tax=Halomonas sp. 25-S5 TaxID=2994065 RepID=UPI002468EDBF|nr:hypothetical protein [Halomonas sp. 25-S5]
MQRRECLALLAGMASLPLGLSGCSLRDDLTFGLHPWPGYEPLFLSRGFGWLPDGITLQRGANAGESLGGLRRGGLARLFGASGRWAQERLCRASLAPKVGGFLNVPDECRRGLHDRGAPWAGPPR